MTLFSTGESTCLCTTLWHKFGRGSGSTCSPSAESDKAIARKAVVASLEAAPYAQYEQIFRNDCPEPETVDASWNGPDYQLCPPGFDGLVNKTIYLRYTHPKFELTRDRHKKVHCRQERVLTIRVSDHVNHLNDWLEMCSDTDFITGKKYPLLLKTPTGKIKNCGTKR